MFLSLGFADNFEPFDEGFALIKDIITVQLITTAHLTVVRELLVLVEDMLPKAIKGIFGLVYAMAEAIAGVPEDIEWGIGLGELEDAYLGVAIDAVGDSSRLVEGEIEGIADEMVFLELVDSEWFDDLFCGVDED